MADAPRTYAELQFESQKWKDFIKKVDKKWTDIEKRKEFAKLVSIPVFADIIDHFEKEAGPEGKWKEWSKVYKDHMKRIGRATNKILQFDGRLRQSFKPTNFRAQQDGVLFYNNAKIKGSNFPYAAAHDEGGPKLPQRKFMWLSAPGMVKIIRITEAWLNPDSGG
jgi:phage gpG-like protein